MIQQQNDLTKNFTRQPYKGQGIYKTPGAITPSKIYNYYQNIGLSQLNDNLSIGGSRLCSWISPVTATIDKILIFNRNSAGTHYPIQLSLYETPDPSLNALTYTKKGQSGDITMTTDGVKILTNANLPVVQGYGYFVGAHRKNTGGTTTPLMVGRSSGFNNVFGNISGSDLSNATPASFTTTISSNTVAGWTGGTATADSIWFLLFYV